MNRINAKFILPVATAIISIIFIYLGLTRFGFWQSGRGPMSGFYPSLISIVLLFISILAFFQAFKEKASVFPKENWLVALSVILILAGTYLLGMLVSILLYIFFWVRYIEKCSWKTTIKSVLFIGGIVFIVFVLWLGVPFPKGLLFEVILG
ncbi:MAG: tripartite tricarboxylate transporter TctB family protein [Clostridia bacterium]